MGSGVVGAAGRARMGYLRIPAVALFLTSVSSPYPSRCSPAASHSLFHLPALLLIRHPPPISYFVLSPSSRETGEPPHPTESTEGALPRSQSAVDTPMRATPRQGRCAGHNGRRYRDSAAAKREDRPSGHEREVRTGERRQDCREEFANGSERRGKKAREGETAGKRVEPKRRDR